MNRSFAVVLTLTALVGACAGAGTAQVVANQATPAAGAARAAGAAGGTGAADAAAKPGDGAQGRRFQQTAGTVEKVDADKLTVKTQTGSVDVPLTEQTTFNKETKVALTDVKVGDNVVGRGEQSGDKLVVRQLQIVPAGGPRGAALGGPGGQAGPAGQGGQGGQGQGGARPQGAGDGQAAAGQGQRGQGGPGGAGGQGGQGQPGQGAFGGGLIGTVAKLDGKTITVTRPNGGESTATLADDAQIQRLEPARRDDLKAGQTVQVAGGQPQDGQPARAVVTITAA